MKLFQTTTQLLDCSIDSILSPWVKEDDEAKNVSDLESDGKKHRNAHSRAEANTKSVIIKEEKYWCFIVGIYKMEIFSNIVFILGYLHITTYFAISVL